MRSTCSVYVDTGYLLAASATRVTGTSLRSGIHVDYALLVSSLVEVAEMRSGLPVLRVHWYDSARHGIPDARQERIGELAKVKLRLGRFGVNGEQKGVDLRIGLDLVTHARNRASDVFFLVSGDDDLTEAVEEAQVHGVQVVLLAVPTNRGTPHGVSRHLLRAADELDTIDGAAVDAAVTRVERHPVPTAQPTSAVDIAAARPTPLDVATAPRPEAPQKRPVVTTGPDLAPAYSSSTGQSPWIAPGFDTDADAAEADGATDQVIGQVVDHVLNSFRSSATPEALGDLQRARPSIPPEIDRALLRDASDAMQIEDLDETVRRELRARFWRRLDTHLA